MLVSGSLPPMMCGVGDYTAQLANALARQESAVEAVAVLSGDGAGVLTDECLYDVLPVAHDWRMSEVVRIMRAIRCWRPDLVHAQFPSQGYGHAMLPWMLPALIALGGTPVVQTWHEYYPQLRGSFRNLPNAIVPGALVVVRPQFRESIAPAFRWLIGKKHLVHIPNSSAIPTVKVTTEERGLIRERVGTRSRDMIAYFGFTYPSKGIELLFDVADPTRHHLVLIGALDPADPYHKSILNLVRSSPWLSHVTVTGFLPPIEAARLLAAADAAVFPFRHGGGIWNSSVHGAMDQGTFVVTTSVERRGYDPAHNVYYAVPGNVEDMRRGLSEYMGRRNHDMPGSTQAKWDAIAEAHVRLYQTTSRSHRHHE